MHQAVTCGIPRSGSTLVWQILQAVFPRHKILKTHPDIWEPDGSAAVVSIRDPRDVVASLYRVRLSRGHESEGAMEDLVNVIRRTKKCFEALDEIFKGPHLLLRYEHFFEDYSIIYDGISSMFGIRVPLLLRKQINKKYSLEANKKRADQLKDFNEVDRHKIHGDHIGKVFPGYWRESLPAWAVLEVEKACEMIAKEWDYE